jgi:allantoinase
MPTPDQVVLGRLVLPDAVRDGGLLLRNGKIAAILSRDEVPADIPVTDYGAAYILPGLIEVHGHMREPGLSHKEDYLTGTSAAVAGGVTTVLDMPNTQPPTTTLAALRDKAALANGRTYCDYAFIFGGSSDNADQIEQIDPDAGEVVGVKFFMAGHETTPTTVANLGDLYAGLRAMQGKGLVALFHAENQQLINRLTAELKADGRVDGRAYSKSRGPLVVQTAIAEALALCEALRIPAYICHISTRAELTAIHEAQLRGVRVYAEAVGYHLTFTIDDYEPLGAWLKVSPPVREAVERDALWGALQRGEIDTLASEHTPHTRDEKTRAIWDAASGMPGIQETLPMVVTQYRQRYPKVALDAILAHIAQLGSSHIAQIFGLADRKGALTVGNDADFTVLDTDHHWALREEDVLSKCGWSAYAGRPMTCRVLATYVRGGHVYDWQQGVIGLPTGQRVFHNQ